MSDRATSRHVYPPHEPECVICGAFGPTKDDQDCLAYIGPIDLGAVVRHAMNVAAHVEREQCANLIEPFAKDADACRRTALLGRDCGSNPRALHLREMRLRAGSGCTLRELWLRISVRVLNHEL